MHYKNYTGIINGLSGDANDRNELAKIRKIMDETEDDNNIAALITVEEAEYVLKNTNTSNPFSSG
ncbi:hypothetical protein UA45_19860, partial [Morganella morganii]